MTAGEHNRVLLSVSVALCTYNGARFLPQQLDSLAAQTRAPDEIVIVDDASTDDTFAMLERFTAAVQVPVKLSRNPTNIGYVRNFETALSKTSGEILMPCDQDDVWHPRKIERLAAELEADERVMLAHANARLVDEAGARAGETLFGALLLNSRERRLIDSGQALRAQLRRNLVTGAACALRRTVFETARPFPSELVHDDWLTLTAAMLGRIERIDEPLLDYRQHEHNQLGIPVRSLAGHIAARPSRKSLEEHAETRLALIAELAAKLGNRNAAELVELHRRHLCARASLPNRLARLPIIAREAVSGRYFECSNGWFSIARDLIG